MTATAEPPAHGGRIGALSIGIPAILAVVVGAWSITVPSLWRDESVSLYFARIPLADAWHIWGHVDAVHATFDLLLRPLAAIEPVELAVRLPSLAGFVVATIGVVLVGRNLSGWSMGACAGCVYALLPVTSRYAQEGRSYALVSAAAVIATWLLLRACERPTRGRLATYAAAIAVLGYLHLYALLLVLVHALHLVVTSRHLVGRAVVAWGVAGVVLLPLAIVASGQRERQLFWLKSPEQDDLSTFIQSIGGTTPAGVALAALVLAGAWVLRRRPIVILWAFVPVIVSFTVSQVYPIFNERYLLFVVPAVALMVGASVDAAARLVRPRVGSVAVSALGVAMIAGLTLPAHQDIRRPDSRPDDLRTMSRDLTADWRPGDGVMPLPAHTVKFMNAYGGPFEHSVPVDVELLPPGMTRIWVITIGYPAVDDNRRPDDGLLLTELDTEFLRRSVESYGMTRVSLWTRRG